MMNSAVWVSMLKFASLGVTVEVVFTAIAKNLIRWRKGQKLDFRLHGVSYLWMLPIYAIIPIVGPGLIQSLSDFPPLVRWSFMALVIYAVEYTAGFLLEKFTGRCPWHYQTGLHVDHFIRLDFLPLWICFAALIEQLLPIL